MYVTIVCHYSHLLFLFMRIFFRTKPEDTFLPNVGVMAPLIGNGAHVSIGGTKPLSNDYEFQQGETLVEVHSFIFISLMSTMHNSLRTFHPYTVYAHVYYCL
jgi:hypothetical protein